MATDTRSFGVKWKPYFKWKRWYKTSSEPDSWNISAPYAKFCKGQVELCTSERTAKKNAVWTGRYKVVRNRKGYVIRKTPIFEPLIGPHRQPNPWFHTKYESTGVDWQSYIKIDATRTLWEAVAGEVVAHALLQTVDVPISKSSLIKAADSILYQEASAQTFDGYLQVGEALEAVAMLKQPLAGLRELGTSLWHKMRKETRGLAEKDLVEAISGAWLEYSFGVSPLINGTAEIASSLVDALTPVPMKYRKSSSYVADESVSITPDYSAKLTSYSEIRGDLITMDQWIVNAGMWLCNDQRAFSLAAQTGLDSMRAIVGQAWALMPLSFAVDWFVGVGPLLDECRPVRGKILSTYRTETLSRTRRFESKYVQGSFRQIRTPAFGHSEQTIMQTQRVTSITPPGSIQLGPGLFSLSQGMSLAALSVAPLKGLWRRLPWH